MNATNFDHNESMGDSYNRKQQSEGKTEASMGMGSGLPAVEKMMKMAAGSGVSTMRDKKERAQLLLGAPSLCEHAGRCPDTLPARGRLDVKSGPTSARRSHPTQQRCTPT